MMEAPVPSRPTRGRRARLRPACLLALLSLGLLLALAAPTAALAREWVPQSSGVTASFADVEFVDAQTGWAVGTQGTIVATTNGGATWVKQNSGTTEYLQKVKFVDRQYGWAVGYNGTILHTTDGGTTWVKQTTNVAKLTNHLYGVSFIDRMNGWICGYWGIVFTTTDGGATWTRLVWPFGENVYITNLWYEILMTDGSHGWMVGEETIAFPSATTPWTRIDVGTNSTNLVALDNGSATSAWAVGYAGAAFSTTDGTTWTAHTVTTVPTDTHHHFLGVACVGPQVVHIASQDRTVYTSVDGGATWQAEAVSTKYILADVDFPDATHGWVVGSSGIIYTYSQAPAKPVATALADVTVKRGKVGKFPYRVNASTATCTATIKIVRKGKTVKTLVIKGAKTNVNLSRSFVCTLAKGAYTWNVTAVDAKGNASDKSPSKKLAVR